MRNRTKKHKPIDVMALPKKARRMARSVRREIGFYNLKETGRRLGVNDKYLHDALRGLEPTDKTENGQSIRMKLGYPKRKRKQCAPRISIPDWLKPIRRGIRAMSKNTRGALKINGG